MEEVLDIFRIVEGGRGSRGFIGFFLVARFPRVYTCRDCQTSTPETDLPFYQPLKIHSRLKSGREICSFLTAWVLVMKFLAWPDVPATDSHCANNTC